MDQQVPSALLSPPELSPLEQELASVLDTMAGRPTTEILDGLRELERKTSLVFTLLKASVYSIVLQQEIDWGGGGGGGGDDGDHHHHQQQQGGR
ncbi:DASH complex subunit Dad3-domain-containing protein [Xylariaceae sp. FL0804]|nr:DASH complex subunit Dad3-domain-containing protein [Xylariaceae sp. FL0804]